MKITFIFSCSGMFRHVPECSMFRILSTPAGNIISSRKNSWLTPCKGIRIPESGKVCGMGDPGNFTCGIQNPERSWGAFLWDDPHQDH